MFHTHAVHVFATMSGNRKGDKSKKNIKRRNVLLQKLEQFFKWGTLHLKHHQVTQKSLLIQMSILDHCIHQMNIPQMLYQTHLQKVLLQEYQGEHQIQD